MKKVKLEKKSKQKERKQEKVAENHEAKENQTSVTRNIGKIGWEHCIGPAHYRQNVYVCTNHTVLCRERRIGYSETSYMTLLASYVIWRRIRCHYGQLAQLAVCRCLCTENCFLLGLTFHLLIFSVYSIFFVFFVKQDHCFRKIV